MRKKQMIVGVVVAVTLLAVSAQAQFPGPGRGPAMRGVWSPVVGSGAAYAVESRGEPKREIEFAIVGTETVVGQPGYWMEMVMRDPEQGQVVTKTLIALAGKDTRVTRMIFQMGEGEPMEMPMEMTMGRGQQPAEPADIREVAEHVGTETVTTPAGTFTCEHYRAKDKSYDVWIAEKVGPYGMVKMTSRDATMTLVRVVANAKTRIRGTPRKFNPMEMMRERPN